MSNLKRIFSILVLLATFVTGVGRAEDTDLFMINPAISSQRPNILIIFDNTSNWSNYFINERSALVSLLSSSTINDKFNLGFMFFNNPNNKNGFNNAEAGVVVAAVRQMTDANKATYAALFSGLIKNNDQGNSAPTVAGAMAEAWRYYTSQNATDGGMNDTQRDYLGNASGNAGYNGVHALAGNALLGIAARQYQSPVVDICQKNFIIFISNGTPSSSEKGEPYDLASQGGSTDAVALPNAFFQTNYADEWTRFMANHTLPNKPLVNTYTVSVDAVNWPSHPDDAQDLLRSMAKQGGGKYVAVSNNAQALVDELDKIFQEIAAVNSVFASVTLPVNVNTSGQSLNQIYMGVFRPDAGASPRWPGNLKEYKIEVKSTGPTMVGRNCAGTPPNQVCDPVHDPVNGFLYSTAQSFWTTANTANITQLISTPPAPDVFQFGAYKFWNSSYYPDAQGAGTPPNGSRDGRADLPDGEMVEKGGAAQSLRGTYSYDAMAASARVPNRKLYTCTGTKCEDQPSSAVDLSTMPFESGNTVLDATAFGLGGAVGISSLTRASSTCSAVSCISRVTATTATSHGFVAGTSVSIVGASDNTFNGSALIKTVPSSNSFTYDIFESPVPLASGSSMTATTSGTGVAITNVAYSDAGLVRTVTVTAPSHGLTVGTPTTVTISGINPTADYSGSRMVTATDANTFAFTIALTPTENPAPGTNTFGSPPYPQATFYTLAGCSNATVGARDIGSAVRNAGSTTLTLTPISGNKTPNTNYASVLLNNGTGYDGCYTCSSGPGVCQKNKTPFAVTVSYTTTTGASPPSLGGAPMMSTSSTTGAISSLTRGPSNCATDPCRATVTVTVPSSSAFAGNSAVISGTGVFDGTYTVTGTPTATTFTYAIDTQPVRDVNTTGMTAGSSTGTLTASELINWVRGQNVKDEDNPSGLTSDVRGYLHGDVLHSRPAIINYNRTSQPTDRDLVVFYGSNDGVLHALKGGRDDADGGELWGFIAPEHFTRFQRMYANAPLWSPTASRPYFFDGPISTMLNGTKDTTTGALRIEGTGAEALVFAGMRRGGRSYYAFDVTVPTDPKYIWRISGGSGDFAELGYTWSEAKVAKVKLGSADTDVLVFGGGYDPVANDASPQGTATMGRGIFMVNARNGELLWRAGPSSSSPTLAVSGMICSIPADVVTLDADGNGYIDRIYAVDTCGNVWRANVGDTDKANWKVAKLFALGGSGVDARKFLYAPSVVRENDYDILLLGSGDREKPFDLGIVNRFYALRDYKGVNDLGGAVTDPTDSKYSPTVLDSDLCDFTSEQASLACNCPWTEKLTAAEGWTPNDPVDSITPPTKRGWKMDFVYDGPDDDTDLDDLCPGEKVVGGAVTIAGITVFSTNVPSASACVTSQNARQCTASTGEARNYVINYQCARPFANQDASSTITIADRFVVDKAGGFPPTGTPIQTTDDNGKGVPSTICIGPNCITVGPSVSPRRHRVYWQMGIDNK